VDSSLIPAKCSSVHRHPARGYAAAADLRPTSDEPPAARTRVPLVIRLVGYTIGVAVIAALLSIPALFFGDGEPTANYEDTSISSYVADFTVRDNGDLDVTETITVDFPVYGKHGIFRFWDRVDINDDNARRDPEDISVTRDGRDEPFELSNEDHGRFRVAKIGSADVTLDTGEHVYVITYHIDGVITEGADDITSERSQF
jgi:hypothetical protein